MTLQTTKRVKPKRTLFPKKKPNQSGLPPVPSPVATRKMVNFWRWEPRTVLCSCTMPRVANCERIYHTSKKNNPEYICTTKQVCAVQFSHSGRYIALGDSAGHILILHLCSNHVSNLIMLIFTNGCDMNIKISCGPKALTV